MLRDEAVVRINDGLGFRPAGHPLTDKIISRLIEAQRDLEHGKTLPRFLVVEDQPLVIPAGAHSVALPDKFLRIDDDNLPHYPASNLAVRFPTYLEPASYSDAVRWTGVTTGSTNVGPNLPGTFTIRNDVIDFITVANGPIQLVWSYYKGSMTLETNVTNHWLTYAPEWLIGEAGVRIAKDARDAGAVDIFTTLRQAGRAAVFADLLMDETAGGPMVMGRWN